MTDLTNPSEKVFRCPAKGCGVMVPASGRDEHKRGHSDEAAFRNRINQFLLRYGGDYIGEQINRIDKHLTELDADVKRIDKDYDGAYKRLDALEDNSSSTTDGPSGVTVDQWDDPDLTALGTDQPDDEATAAPTPATTIHHSGLYTPGQPS